MGLASPQARVKVHIVVHGLELGPLGQHRVELAGLRDLAPLAAAQHVEAEVGEDSVHVGREVAGRLVLRRVPEELHEQLLREVLRRVMVAEDPPAVPVDRALVALDQLAEGLDVATTGADEEFVVAAAGGGVGR